MRAGPVRAGTVRAALAGLEPGGPYDRAMRTFASNPAASDAPSATQGTGGGPRAERRRLRWAAACWLASRTLLLLVTTGVLRVSALDVTSDVKVIYRGWAAVLGTGTFPLDDVTWQYPPLAAAVVSVPGWLASWVPPLGYFGAFLLLVAACDAAVMAALLRAARRSGGPASGCLLWAAVPPLLGPTLYARFDVVVTAVAVGALLALPARPRLAGALLAAGTMLKLWPVVLLAGVRGPRGRRTAVWTLGGAAVIGAGFAACTVGAFSFLGFQGGRGVEIESVAALPFYYALRLGGWPGREAMHYGSPEFLGPGVGAAADAVLACTALAACWLLAWRRRARTASAAAPSTGRQHGGVDATRCADAGFTALLLFTVTSRVLSPQYLVWLLGAAAVCLGRADTSQRSAARLLVPATVLTTLEFPLFFGTLTHANGWGIALITLRNGLLLAAALLSARRLWQAESSAAAPALALTPAPWLGSADPGRLLHRLRQRADSGLEDVDGEHVREPGAVGGVDRLEFRRPENPTVR